MEEKELIEKIIAGESELFREIVSRYYPKVIQAAKKVAREEKDAEDIAQLVFLQVFRSLASFRFESSFSTWLYRITMTKSLDWHRKHRKLCLESDYQENDRLKTIPSPMKKPEDELLHQEELKQLQHKLKCLPVIYQQVMTLYYFHECTYKEIADQLNISSKTVESRLYRGKALLRDLVRKERLN